MERQLKFDKIVVWPETNSAVEIMSVEITAHVSKFVQTLLPSPLFNNQLLTGPILISSENPFVVLHI